MISKKLTLEGSTPVVIASNPIDYYRPKRDPFETQAEFAAREEPLRQQIDAAVAARKQAFIAGTATLDKSGYDIESGEFPVTGAIHRIFKLPIRVFSSIRSSGVSVGEGCGGSLGS